MIWFHTIIFKPNKHKNPLFIAKTIEWISAPFISIQTTPCHIHSFLSHYSTVIVLFIRISSTIKTLMFRERLEKAKTNLETKTKNVAVWFPHCNCKIRSSSWNKDISDVCTLRHAKLVGLSILGVVQHFVHFFPMMPTFVWWCPLLDIVGAFSCFQLHWYFYSHQEQLLWLHRMSED